MIMIQQPEEQERVRQLEEQVKQLEALVTQLSLEKFIAECALEVAEEDLGYKVKKKSVTESLAKRKKIIRKRR
jgi:hypothetical protein